MHCNNCSATLPKRKLPASRINRLLAVVVVAAGCIAGADCARADIVYNIVNDTVDQGGWNLSGTSTTDGTIGTIENIEFDLKLSNGATTYEISDVTSGYGGNSDALLATSTLQLQLALSITGFLPLID
jgi:hypothetical protein